MSKLIIAICVIAFITTFSFALPAQAQVQLPPLDQSYVYNVEYYDVCKVPQGVDVMEFDKALVQKYHENTITNEEKAQVYCINQVRINSVFGFQ